MILVTTAGKFGSAAVHELTRRGVPVRVLVRNPDKAKPLAAAGADVVQGDLEVPARIDAAMTGVTTVVLISPPVVVQEVNVIDSAVRAGVGHVVKITSKASADSPIARRRWQIEIEAALAASGIPHTLLRSNGQMQNLLALAPSIAKTGSFGAAAGQGRVGMVDARDVGEVAAVIAASPRAHAGKTYWPSGPEALSYADVAAVLSRVLGRTITYRELTFEENKQAMIAAGLPEPLAHMNALAVSLIATGDSAFVTDDVPSLLGRPARSFEAFATEYAKAFSG